jgi:hypothetical protein
VKGREQFWRDALGARESYRATGLHLAGEEADACMARLEAGEEVEAPECHG